MAATTMTKQQALSQVFGAAEPAGEQDAPLPVLEQFLFGICREDSTPEMARMAYANLRSQFFDWNEVRVSSVREIEDALAGLSDTEARAERVIAFLQEVFETTFSFDLEAVQKKGLKHAAKTLRELKGANDYVVAWVIQRTLGGHAIPVDGATIRQALKMGLLDETASGADAARASLEHMVPKAKGIAFTDGISVLAEQGCWDEVPARATVREAEPAPTRSRAKPR